MKAKKKTIIALALPSIALGFLTLATGSASAGTVLTSNGDTYIRSSTPTTNYNTAPNYMVANDNGTDVRMAVFSFDLSSVTVGSITNAKLQLDDVIGNANQTYEIWGLLDVHEDFDESTLTWSTAGFIDGTDNTTIDISKAYGGTLLGTFSNVKNTVNTLFDVTSGTFLDFLNASGDNDVTFVIVDPSSDPAGSGWATKEATADLKPTLTLVAGGASQAGTISQTLAHIDADGNAYVAWEAESFDSTTVGTSGDAEWTTTSDGTAVGGTALLASGGVNGTAYTGTNYATYNISFVTAGTYSLYWSGRAADDGSPISQNDGWFAPDGGFGDTTPTQRVNGFNATDLVRLGGTSATDNYTTSYQWFRQGGTTTARIDFVVSAANVTNGDVLTLSVGTRENGSMIDRWILSENSDLFGSPAGDTAAELDAFATAPTGNTYADWLLLNAPATGFDTDTDKDGVPNGVENVLGSDPNSFSQGLTEISATATSATFKHQLNPTIASDITYTYEWSTDLTEWKAHGETNTGGTTATIVPSLPASGVVTVVVTITGGPSSKVFGRLVAHQ